MSLSREKDIVGTPCPSLTKRGGSLSFRNFWKKGRGGDGSDFSHEKGGVVKMGRLLLKREVSLILIQTNPFQCYLSVSVWCMCVLFIYTISISIICASLEEPSLIASNQQIYDCYNWIIFQKKRHCGK